MSDATMPERAGAHAADSNLPERTGAHAVDTVERDDFIPVTNPGLEEYVPRYSDVDAAEGNRKYRTIVFLFGVVVPILAIAFCVIYFAVPKNAYVDIAGLQLGAQHVGLGLCAAFAMLALGVGAEKWAKDFMNDHEVAEERHPVASSPEVRRAFIADVDDGIKDSGISRRKLLGASLLGGLGLALVPAVLTLADLGPWPLPSTRKKTIMKTLWAEGVRLVNDVTYAPIKASDLEIGQLVNAEPENLKDLHEAAFQEAKAKAALIIVRMDPKDIKIPESRRDWQVNGILAYSKICTHVGCPISLWEQQTHHLLCPCHQSTFDLADSGVVVFGPAARALPQLPITVDSEGYLVARSDFTVPVGPSFFERDSRGDYKKGDR